MKKLITKYKVIINKVQIKIRALKKVNVKV